MVICEKCGREFKTNEGLSSHKRSKNLETLCQLFPRKCLNPNCNNNVKIGNKYCCCQCASKTTTPGRKHSLETRMKISIANGGTGKVIEYQCLNCGSATKNDNKFCSKLCNTTFTTKQEIELLPFENLRKRLIYKILYDENGNKCQECGFEYTNEKGKGPFDIHHVDGNNKNWKKENLKILCLNCHWKTDNWRFRNKHHTKETKQKISNYLRNR